MAAEAFFLDERNKLIKDQAGLIRALMDSNRHASRFTDTQAKKFADANTGWTVVSQYSADNPGTENVIETSTTGFSGTLFKNNQTGEYVLSFRSTELIDDAARDNRATNTLEISNTGFAFGQIAEMEAWYSQIKSTIGDPSQLSVTGYSLGGHLATVFNLLRKEEGVKLKQVVTFNGAGVGEWKTTSLTQLVSGFSTLLAEAKSGDLSQRIGITDPALKAIYLQVRQALQNGQDPSSTDLETLQTWSSNATESGAGNTIAVQIGKQSALILAAWESIKAIKTDLAHIATVTPGDGSASVPNEVQLLDIAQAQLDYQIAIQLTKSKASSGSLVADAIQALLGKSYGSEILSNQFDVVGGGSPSAVANSKYHWGSNFNVFIEDQGRGLK